MRATCCTLIVGVLALLAAAPAWASDPSDPRFAPRTEPVPAEVPVDARLRLRSPTLPDEAWLAGGDGCCAPCCPPPCAPCAPPAPCGVCRQGTDACGNPTWGFQLALAGWLPGLNGRVGARGRETDVDFTPSDALNVLSELDFTIMGEARVTYGRWNFRSGIYYLGMGTEANVGADSSLDVSYDQWIVSGIVGYRVAETSLGCGDGATCMAVQPYIGVRYNSLSLTLDDTRVATTQDTNWADLIVGTELIFDFRNNWWAHVAGDIGGFGLSGGSSDFTWSIRGEVGYSFNEHVGVFLGLAAIDWDYKDGTFVWNLTQYGPYLGVLFTF